MTSAPFPPNGRVITVNAGPARTVTAGNRTFTTAIVKTPVDHRVAVVGVNVAGDDQADRDAHGGPTRALYAYAEEDYAWWLAARPDTYEPGRFGENLTLAGIDVTNARIGERWQVGEIIVRVTSPRVPCYKLAWRMNDPQFVKTFTQALRPGTYLAIEREGEIGAGDPVSVLSRPAHDMSIGEMMRIYAFERERLGELLVPELPEHWRIWVEEQLERT